jgi:hypothetical protein
VAVVLVRPAELPVAAAPAIFNATAALVAFGFLACAAVAFTFAVAVALVPGRVAVCLGFDSMTTGAAAALADFAAAIELAAAALWSGLGSTAAAATAPAASSSTSVGASSTCSPARGVVRLRAMAYKPARQGALFLLGVCDPGDQGTAMHQVPRRQLIAHMQDAVENQT